MRCTFRVAAAEFGLVIVAAKEPVAFTGTEVVTDQVKLSVPGPLLPPPFKATVAPGMPVGSGALMPLLNRGFWNVSVTPPLAPAFAVTPEPPL